jgi:pimeloyl-ACP methyl ester carboxylesterase
MQATPQPLNDAFVTMPSKNFQVVVRGRNLEVLRIAPPVASQSLSLSARLPASLLRPELVFLHESLGSVSHWKDFPERVAAATQCPVTVYSRLGSGNSDVLTEPRAVSYMHDEALKFLPELLTKLQIENPILIGHSDGASIALIFAGAHHAGAHHRVRGLVLMAPHVFVEDLSVSSIAAAKISFQTTNLAEKLSRHHRDPARTFWGWNNIWLHPEFRAWNIEQYLPIIMCPILAIQGIDDQYGTMAQVQAIARQSGGPVEILPLADCRHSPQRDQSEATLAAIAKFVKPLCE